MSDGASLPDESDPRQDPAGAVTCTTATIRHTETHRAYKGLWRNGDSGKIRTKPQNPD
jgi:hypothetical protein